MTLSPDADADDNLQRRRVMVLAGSVAMLLISGGGMYLIVVALKEVAMEFGWPRAVPSLAFSLQFIGSGIGSIVMGYVLDRYGFIVPAVIGAVMVGLGGICGSFIESAWQLYLVYAFMFGLSGQGSLAAPALANIARWYDKRRGMAVGIASSGQALAGIVWPPIFGVVLAAIGWRDMFFWFGVFSLCLMLPLCIVVRHRPPPYKPPAEGSGGTAGSRPHDRRGPPPAPLSTRAIQTTLCVAIFGCCVAMSLPLGHLVSLVNDRGHPIADAVNVLAVMLMAAFFSRAVLIGVLSDRLGGLRSLLVFSFVQGTSLAVFTVTHELWALYTVALVCGLGYGGLFPIYAVVTREHLPILEAGRRTGLIFMVGAVAMGFGGWMGGYLFDLTGAYTLPFLIGVGFNVANFAIVVALTLRIRPPWPLRANAA